MSTERWNSLIVRVAAVLVCVAFAAPMQAWPLHAGLAAPVVRGFGPERLVGDLASVPRDHGPVSRELVAFETAERPGTIIISTQEKYLYRVLGDGRAERYLVSVGRDGFSWTGTVYVGAKSEWPGWTPPSAMRARQPTLPEYVPPGPYNPLGARALYLYQNGRDTLYRIHGTNDAGSLGSYQTSGCFRMSNADVITLFRLVSTGTKVIVR